MHSGTALEYKYTILRAGEVIWENGPVNRSIKTGTEMIVVNDGWFNGIRVDVQTAPLPAQDALAAVNSGQVLYFFKSSVLNTHFPLLLT